MEVLDILLEYVGRSKVGSTAKPPLPWCSGSICHGWRNQHMLVGSTENGL